MTRSTKRPPRLTLPRCTPVWCAGWLQTRLQNFVNNIQISGDRAAEQTCLSRVLHILTLQLYLAESEPSVCSLSLLYMELGFFELAFYTWLNR